LRRGGGRGGKAHFEGEHGDVVEVDLDARISFLVGEEHLVAAGSEGEAFGLRTSAALEKPLGAMQRSRMAGVRREVRGLMSRAEMAALSWAPLWTMSLKKPGLLWCRRYQPFVVVFGSRYRFLCFPSPGKDVQLIQALSEKP
jgi:hypothetical protein